ncbi:10193_t:CDS:2, partial [Ambispora gerdemannii]
GYFCKCLQVAEMDFCGMKKFLPQVRTFCGFIDLKAGAYMITVFALLNKISGFYGVSSLLDGGGITSIISYFYSMIAAAGFACSLYGMYNVGARRCDNYIRKLVLYLTILAKTLGEPKNITSVSTTILSRFRRRVSSEYAKWQDSSNLLPAWKAESTIAIMFLLAIWIIHVYFAIVIQSYADLVCKRYFMNLSSTSGDVLMLSPSSTLNNSNNSLAVVGVTHYQQISKYSQYFLELSSGVDTRAQRTITTTTSATDIVETEDDILINSLLKCSFIGDKQQLNMHELIPPSDTNTNTIPNYGNAMNLIDILRAHDQLKLMPVEKYKEFYASCMKNFEISMARQVFDLFLSSSENSEKLKQDLKFAQHMVAGEFLLAKACLEERTYDDPLPFSLESIFNELIRNYLERNNVVMIDKLLVRMTRDFGILPKKETIHSVVLCCKSMDGLLEARSLIMSLFHIIHEHEIKLESLTYDYLLNLFATYELRFPARTLFDDMLKMNITPSIHAFSNIMHLFAKSVNTLVNYHELMEQLKVKPNVHTYTILIGSLGRAGFVQEAANYFHEMTEKKKIEPNRITYTELVKICTENAQSEDVSSGFFEAIKKSGRQPDVVAYTALIQAKAEAMRFSEALMVYQDMLRDNVKPNQQTFTVLLDVCIQAGEFETCHRIYDVMKSTGLQPDLHVYCTLLNAFCQEKKIDQAVFLFQDMLEQGIKPDQSCYNCLMHAFNRNGMPESVFAFYNMMIKSIRPDQVSWRILWDTCYFHKRLDEARDFFRDMEKITTKLYDYAIMRYIQLLAENKQIIEALTILLLAREKEVRFDRHIVYKILLTFKIHGTHEMFNEVRNILQDQPRLSKKVPTREKLDLYIKNLKRKYQFSKTVVAHK